MGNEQNLKPLNTRSQRERKEIARMGALASNKVQANKKLLRESAKILLSMPVDKKTETDLKAYNLSDKDCSFAMALVVAQMKKALQGNTASFNAIRDIVGENPKENKQEDAQQDSEITINVIPASKSQL